MSKSDFTMSKPVELGSLKIGDSIDIEMKLTLKDQNIDHVISDRLTIE